jgi:hypothetical protein
MDIVGRTAVPYSVSSTCASHGAKILTGIYVLFFLFKQSESGPARKRTQLNCQISRVKKKNTWAPRFLFNYLPSLRNVKSTVFTYSSIYFYIKKLNHKWLCAILVDIIEKTKRASDFVKNKKILFTYSWFQ